MIKSTSNAGKKRRRRLRNIDEIEGDHLSVFPKKVTRKASTEALEDEEENTLIEDVHVMPKRVKISLEPVPEVSESRDVIFVPTVQTTRYSLARTAKLNLERRMPGYTVDVLYGSGEGLVKFYAKASLCVEDKTVSISAECVASPSDLALRHVEIVHDGQIFSIEPVDRALSPEEAVVALKKIATNIVSR
jgi:hypothetical protein